ncbi:MAG: hypothetical protein HXX13_13465 [Bacteroidetes bacterium]|nr:hypothetical protein [Bacteroidota bacterium]
MHEVQAEATIASNGLNFKIAYSPLNHICLQFNGQYTYSSQYTKPQYHEYIEGAIGSYFIPNERLLLEMYLGYGSGDSNFGDAGGLSVNRLTSAKGHYQKEYLQFNIGTPISKKRALFGGCVRIGNVSYTYESANLSNLTGHTYNHFTVEPYLFLRTNAKRKLGFTMNAGLTLMDGIDETIRTNVLNLGIGLNYTLGRNPEK